MESFLLPSFRKLPDRVGLGNGKKKSELYFSYVTEKRQHLRDDLHLCEKACQKLLGYSNNLLYRRLKTEQVLYNINIDFVICFHRLLGDVTFRTVRACRFERGNTSRSWWRSSG